VTTYHEIGGVLEYALDFIDVYDMWKNVYMYQSLDVARTG